ncbi:elongation factor P [Calothrix sp. PCC 7507]|uniref:elongation factor P n=1 Tax=Calothrix sp. PCC 7507 TaxID=99598 RepID=UPI00029EE73C|nr:elongation factor P [Calothrix sp. PCC 7507]AFY30555.1 Elongation factor P [Calothrix sp. PCC 7507]
MISSNDFRPGVSIVLDGSVWRVIDFLHVKPGKGSAFVRTTLKNVQTGKQLERTFRAGESVPQANIEKITMQHTYKDGDEFVFMDMETYEESRLSATQIGDRVKYLKEGMEAEVVRWDEQVLGVELPKSVTLEVVQTDPGVKGDTATGGSKPATLETGAVVMVPLFITQGERIRIDTSEDKYISRE